MAEKDSSDVDAAREAEQKVLRDRVAKDEYRRLVDIVERSKVVAREVAAEKAGR